MHGIGQGLAQAEEETGTDALVDTQKWMVDVYMTRGANNPSVTERGGGDLDLHFGQAGTTGTCIAVASMPLFKLTDKRGGLSSACLAVV